MSSQVDSPQMDQQLLTQLAMGLNIESSDEFFAEMARQLSEILGVDYALVGELSLSDPGRVDTLAFVADGEVVENFSYPLRDTPCEKVFENKLCIYPEKVQELFPKDRDLIDMGIVGYAGLPLKNVAGKPVGLVNLLFRRPIPNPDFVEKLLLIFASRAGSEMERYRNQRIAIERQRETAERVENYRLIYENSPLSYQSLDGDGCFADVNPFRCETFGYSRTEIIGRKFADIIPPDSAAVFAERFPELKQQGEVNDASFEIQHKDGHIIIAALYCKSNYDEAGNFLHANCILIDITAARKSELLLRRREVENRLLTLQLQTLLDSIPDRIMLLDSDMRIVWTNQSQSLDGIPLGDTMNDRPCHEIMHGSEEPCPDCPSVKCFRDGEVIQGERLALDGKTWLLRAFPVFDDQGKVFNVVEIGQDITDKVMMQKEMVRTGQLAALGELAAGVAHEINNPITGVINYAQLIKNRTDEASAAQPLADGIIREGDRIAKIVKQLLFLSRNDKGDFVPLDITEALSDCLSMVASQFNSQGIELQISLAENLPKMVGNPQQLEQLFFNILSNARYALNKKYPDRDANKLLEVTLDSEDVDDTSMLVIQLLDHGMGIPVSLLNKVTQPFITSKPSAEGTGLGLSISNDIVNRHNGSMSIDSEEGKWTEVVLRFPVNQ